MGACEALFLAMNGILEPDDEIIFFEPFFDVYIPQSISADAKPVFVPLNTSDWSIDYTALENAITDKTKMLLINNPHNPTGRLYTEAELRELALFLERYPRIIVISDEVYEEHIYKEEKMFRLGSIMWDRCISIYSGGKLFNVTGWKTGWAVGATQVIYPM